jgi:hypothetical protein
MQEHWDVILSMLKKLAGGSVGELLKGSVFLEQLKEVDSNAKDSIVLASIMKNPHTPIRFRVLELQRFRQSRALATDSTHIL